jgi:hypothetical protein
VTIILAIGGMEAATQSNVPIMISLIAAKADTIPDVATATVYTNLLPMVLDVQEFSLLCGSARPWPSSWP